MSTETSYPLKVKEKAIQMKLDEQTKKKFYKL